MHKIDHPTATPDGLFTIGDPVGGLPATVVTADWLNAVQTELINAVEAAGLTPDKPDNTQLKQAIEVAAASGFQTGDVVMTLRPVASPGWIICDDGSIGSAASGASTRANDDCWPLYSLLWTNVADAYAPVSGGRGASAEVDWAANKSIGLTKMLGRALGVAGAGASLTERDLGQSVGDETHTLTESEMPSHTHKPANSGGRFIFAPDSGPNTANGNGNVTWGTTFTTGSTGGNQAHNNMQPTVFLRAHIKL